MGKKKVHTSTHTFTKAIAPSHQATTGKGKG